MTPEEVNEELKATIREARGMIKDMREHIHNLAELNVYTRDLIERHVDELVTEEVKKALDEVRKGAQVALDRAVKQTCAKYDEFVRILNGTDKESRRAGSPSTHDLIKAYALTNRTGIVSPLPRKKKD